MELSELTAFIREASSTYRPIDERNPMACDTRRPAAAQHVAQALIAAGVVSVER
jgi:hypothetical protein